VKEIEERLKVVLIRYDCMSGISFLKGKEIQKGATDGCVMTRHKKLVTRFKHRLPVQVI